MPTPQSPVRSQFSALRWRLLLAFLGVVSITLGVGGISVYRVVAGSLYQRLDQSLFTLANAAAHAMTVRPPPGSNLGREAEYEAEHEYEEDHEDGEEGRDSLPVSHLDNDGDLDLPWQTLRQPRQGIEWFAANGELQRSVGNVVENLPLSDEFDVQPIPHHRLLTVPVYQTDDEGALQGYVRVTTDTLAIEGELQRLQRGLWWGGFVALGVCGIGSWGLMRLAMTPIEQSFERLRQFTADASHELRSPLTAIQTSMAVMQSHPERLHPADARKIDLTASAARQMGRLVDDLLLLARLDNAPDRSIQTPLPLDELLEDLAELYAEPVAAKALSLQTRLTAQVVVEGDPDQLKRLFSNLLDNAIRYTSSPGKILLDSEIQDSSVVVTIADTGCGIAPEHLAHIYDRFWRADSARSHRGGSGLGLAIAKGIVQAHRGSLNVTSQLGQGTTVQVRLPFSSSLPPLC